MLSRNKWRVALFMTSVMAGVIPAAAAFAADDANDVEDVVVTARKREEKLQDVPLAVTAISGATLERQNVVSVNDLSTKSPSLMVSPGLGSSRASPNFAIRGLSQQEQTPLADPSVTVYTGDIVAPRQQGLNGSLIDIGSVQVLKGPQGTLFGRNTTGGAIIIKPNAPELGAFDGYVGAGIGERGIRSVEAVVNVPVGEKAAARFAMIKNGGDGYIKDVLLNKNINYVDNYSLRASLLIKPTDNVDSLFVANVYHEDDGGQGSFIYNVNPAGSFNSAPARAARNYPTLESLLAAQQARGDYETASGTPQYTKVKTFDLANTTNIHFGDNLTIRNIIGGRTVKQDQMEDVDGLPIPLLEIERHFKDTSFSEEFQVLGETGNLQWIVGAYYFHEKGDDQGLSVTGGVDPGVNQPASVKSYASWSNTWIKADNTSTGIFAQGTYKLDSVLEGLSITGGLRGNWDKREAHVRNRTQATCRFTRDLDNNPATAETNPGLAGCDLPLSAKFDEPTYNLSLDWKIDADTLVYAAHRHGYRTGGFGARAATQAGLERTFTPETVTDFEVGVKKDWHFGDAFLRTNLALYSADYKDIQRLLTDPNTIPVTTVTVNAASATIRGAEFEWLFKPTSWVEFSGFYSYTDAGYDKFITPANVDLSKNPFARAPKDLFSASLRFFVPTDSSIGDVSFGGTYFHSSDFYINDDIVTGVFASATHYPSYENVDLDAEWKNVLGSNFDLQAYVKNATDEVVLWPELQIITSLGFDARTYAPPRTFGVKAKYRF